jgi:hypothetical protein
VEGCGGKVDGGGMAALGSTPLCSMVMRLKRSDGPPSLNITLHDSMSQHIGQ